MPAGSVAGDGYDTAPAESPVLVTGNPIHGGTVVTFSASGIISHGFFDESGHGPEGVLDSITSRIPGPENGIGNINAPFDAVLGVFLDSSAPNLLPPPSMLNFGTAAQRDFLTLAPALRQPFFIGDGHTSLGVVQQFTAPAGTTRLYIGVMDSYEWHNNTGSFTVTVNTPEPSSVILLAVGCAVVAIRPIRVRSAQWPRLRP